MKLAILLLMASGLWAQDAALKPCVGGANPSSEPCASQPVFKTASNPEPESAKARIAWLEQKLSITEAKMAALMQFYSANEQLQGLAAKEPKTTATANGAASAGKSPEAKTNDALPPAKSGDAHAVPSSGK